MIHASEFNGNGHFLHCESDHAAIDVTPYTLTPRRTPDPAPNFTLFTHNMGWLDNDNVQHGLTIRTNDPEELWALVKSVKRVIRASREQHAEAHRLLKRLSNLSVKHLANRKSQ